MSPPDAAVDVATWCRRRCLRARKNLMLTVVYAIDDIWVFWVFDFLALSLLHPLHLLHPLIFITTTITPTPTPTLIDNDGWLLLLYSNSNPLSYRHFTFNVIRIQFSFVIVLCVDFALWLYFVILFWYYILPVFVLMYDKLLFEWDFGDAAHVMGKRICLAVIGICSIMLFLLFSFLDYMIHWLLES